MQSVCKIFKWSNILTEMYRHYLIMTDNLWKHVKLSQNILVIRFHNKTALYRHYPIMTDNLWKYVKLSLSILAIRFHNKTTLYRHYLIMQGICKIFKWPNILDSLHSLRSVGMLYIFALCHTELSELNERIECI